MITYADTAALIKALADSGHRAVWIDNDMRGGYHYLDTETCEEHAAQGAAGDIGRPEHSVRFECSYAINTGALIDSGIDVNY